MEFSSQKKSSTKDSCQHDEYCGLAETVCEETDFADKCRMKESDAKDMPLLNEVKKRVERDKKRTA